MARGDPFLSPWLWAASDYLGRAITITVTFDNTTKALSSGSIVRATGGLYGHLYIGLGVDGSPNSTTHQFAVPVGTTGISKGQFSANGLNTIDDILALQITAGP